MNTRITNQQEKGENFKEIYSLLLKSAPALYVLSILLGVSILINLFSAAGRENYFILTSIPELLTINHGYLILIFLSFLILTGSIGSYFRWKYAMALLTCGWGLLTFGVRLWDFVWLPTLNFGLPISFSFLGSFIYIKINLAPLFFFFWSLSLLPKKNRFIL